MSESMTPQEAEREAQRIIAEAFEAPVPAYTSFRDNAPPEPTGAEPVAQPDTRVVPTWAVGTAVASIGLGAGSVGIGCAIWLAAQGLAAITLTGVLAALVPFVGVALVVLAVGAALNRAGSSSSSSTHVYNAPVVKHTQVTPQTRGMLSRSRTEVHS
ncbi:hypothetical protein [Streptomyces oceani]|uniref:Uncharacterized protein n=1 Tax=Streptomyces oceani TaxID=1075402 RepID=A0A1E7JW17_9ACTN|nr:hypothetical protein [Streptomyces oceani]OEU95479.1 hypothetical protein AN216_23530 [Streptomyces oceani]